MQLRRLSPQAWQIIFERLRDSRVSSSLQEQLGRSLQALQNSRPTTSVQPELPSEKLKLWTVGTLERFDDRGDCAPAQDHGDQEKPIMCKGQRSLAGLRAATDVEGHPVRLPGLDDFVFLAGGDLKSLHAAGYHHRALLQSHLSGGGRGRLRTNTYICCCEPEHPTAFNVEGHRTLLERRGEGQALLTDKNRTVFGKHELYGAKTNP